MYSRLTLANSLSASRFGLAALAAWATAVTQWQIAGAAVVLAVASDVADGWVARRFGNTSVFGGVLDHAADATFVTTLLLMLSIMGIVPAPLVVLVPAAFLQYVLDSQTLAGHPLRSSWLGRNNGIAYFVLAGFPVMQHALDVYLLPEQTFYWVGWLLVTTTLISMFDRYWTWRKLSRHASEANGD